MKLSLPEGKIYYSIGEVAALFKVNPSLIRFWEKEFSILKPKKNNKGNRIYTVNDIKKLTKIYELVKEKGMTLNGAKKMLQQTTLFDLTGENAPAPHPNPLRQKLLAIKTQLEEIKKILDI